MANDYTALDAALIEHIKKEPRTFTFLQNRLHDIAEPFAVPNRYGDTDAWRVIDRRLQALRKKGVIRPERMGRNTFWKPVEPAP